MKVKMGAVISSELLVLFHPTSQPFLFFTVTTKNPTKLGML